MTDSPFAYSKWKEACKNISGKDRGFLLNKHERAWIKPKNISRKNGLPCPGKNKEEK